MQTRLDLWLKTHIEKLLGPLFGLQKAEDVTGIARGIAFQLIEALGVLERAKISAEMKDLDQPSRALLRKYGVRFGAYHIYFPALLKPAARSLALLLWAEKQSNVDLSALSGAQHLASSGRTSFPADKTLPRDAYRVLGYRQCGERAVRVDILERLADLIRPALAWRENAPGEKPAGAFDGRGFVVTQAMTSLTGSAGEDFASILRALGYRMDRKPPLPPKPVEVVSTVAADTPPVEGAGDALAASGDPSPSAALLPMVTIPPPTTIRRRQPARRKWWLRARSKRPRWKRLPLKHPKRRLLPRHRTMPLPAKPRPREVDGRGPRRSGLQWKPNCARDRCGHGSGCFARCSGPGGNAAAEVATTPLLRQKRRPSPNWSKSGVPAAAPTSAAPRHDRGRHHRHQNKPEGAAAAEGATEGGEGAKQERHRGRRNRHRDFQKPREGAPAARLLPRRPRRPKARRARARAARRQGPPRAL